MNVLSCMLMEEEKKGSVKGVQFGRRGPSITNLMYADDVALFLQASMESCSNIVGMNLDNFCNMAKLNIYWRKSTIVFSINPPRRFKKVFSKFLGMCFRDSFGKYLGCNIEGGRNFKQAFQEIMEKLDKKIPS